MISRLFSYFLYSVFTLAHSHYFVLFVLMTFVLIVMIYLLSVSWRLALFLLSSIFLWLLFDGISILIKLINHQFQYHIFFEEIERCPLINCWLDSFLLLSSFYNPFLDCPFRNQLININILTLPNSMSSISGLCIHRRIPIIVVKDNGIGCCQSHTKPTWINENIYLLLSKAKIQMFSKCSFGTHWPCLFCLRCRMLRQVWRKSIFSCS